MPSHRIRQSNKHVRLVLPIKSETPVVLEPAGTPALLEVSSPAGAVAVGAVIELVAAEATNNVPAAAPKRSGIPRGCIIPPSDYRVAFLAGGHVVRSSVEAKRESWAGVNLRYNCAPGEFEADIKRRLDKDHGIGPIGCGGMCLRCGHVFYSSATTIPFGESPRDGEVVDERPPTIPQSSAAESNE